MSKQFGTLLLGAIATLQREGPEAAPDLASLQALMTRFRREPLRVDAHRGSLRAHLRRRLSELDALLATFRDPLERTPHERLAEHFRRLARALDA